MEQFLFFSVIILWFLCIINFFFLILLFRQFGEIYLHSGDGIAKDGIPIGNAIPKERIYSIRKKQHVYLQQDDIHKPSLFIFISADCKPCKQLLEEWNNAVTFNSVKVDYYIIFIGEEKKVFNLISKYKPNAQLFWDKNEGFFRRWKVRVTPFAFAVDKNGVVQDKGLCGTKDQMDLYVQSIFEVSKNSERS